MTIGFLKLILRFAVATGVSPLDSVPRYPKRLSIRDVIKPPWTMLKCP